MLKKEDIVYAIKVAKQIAKKRNFIQSLDLLINLKDMDFKKESSRIELDVILPYSMQKTEQKKLVFVQDKNFAAQLRGKADKIIMVDEIASIKKKELEELLNEYSVWLAEGPAMLIVGKYLGQTLVPLGRMPKPISPTLESFEKVSSSFGSSIRISNKKGRILPFIHMKIGDENSKEEEVAENIIAIYDTLVQKLPQKEFNIKSICVKLTMGPPIKVGSKEYVDKQAELLKKEKEIKSSEKE